MTIGKMKRLMAGGSLGAINAWLMESVGYNHTGPETSAPVGTVPTNIKSPSVDNTVE